MVTLNNIDWPKLTKQIECSFFNPPPPPPPPHVTVQASFTKAVSTNSTKAPCLVIFWSKNSIKAELLLVTEK